LDIVLLSSQKIITSVCCLSSATFVGGESVTKSCTFLGYYVVMSLYYRPYYRRLRFSSDADIVRLTNARIIIIITEWRRPSSRSVSIMFKPRNFRFWRNIPHSRASDTLF